MRHVPVLMSCLGVLVVSCSRSTNPGDGPSATGQLAPADDSRSFKGAQAVLDFKTSQYPPWVNKIGYNAFWNRVEQSELEQVEMGARYRMPVAAGLVELVNIDPQAGGYADPLPPFVRSGSSIAVNLQTGYQALRRKLRDNNIIQFTQFCGTPFVEETVPFTDPNENLFPMLHNYYLKAFSHSRGIYEYRSGKDAKISADDSNPNKNIGGNFYPLPSEVGMNTYAEVMGRYIGEAYEDAKTPSIISFWQEPSHTVANKHAQGSPKIANMKNYLTWYSKVSRQLKNRNPDLMLAGFQLNSPNHLNVEEEFDGKTNSQWALEELQRIESSEGVSIPMDFYSLQVFDVTALDRQLRNLRQSMRGNRFNTVPVIYNRFLHISGTERTRNTDELFLFNENEGLIPLLDTAKFMMKAPDIAYALLSKWNFAVNNPEDKDDRPLLVFPVLDMLTKLVGDHVPVQSDEASKAGIEILAAHSSSGKNILIWNKGDDQSLRLRVLNAGATSAKLTAIENDSLSTGQTVNLGEMSLSLKKFGIYHLEITSNPQTNLLRRAVFTKPLMLVNRQDNGEAPQGFGHIDTHTMTLTAASNGTGSEAVGMIGAVLRDLPAESYTLGIKFSKKQVVPKGAVAGVRLDFLDGLQAMKTIIFSNDATRAVQLFAKQTQQFNPPLPTGTKPLLRRLTPQELSTGRINWNVQKEAPAAWVNADKGSRRVLITLFQADDASGSALNGQLID